MFVWCSSLSKWKSSIFLISGTLSVNQCRWTGIRTGLLHWIFCWLLHSFVKSYALAFFYYIPSSSCNYSIIFHVLFAPLIFIGLHLVRSITVKVMKFGIESNLLERTEAVLIFNAFCAFFMPLLDTDSREMTGNEGVERWEWHATNVCSWTQTRDIAVHGWCLNPPPGPPACSKFFLLRQHSTNFFLV